MKGYRFFAEMPQDRKSKSASKSFPHFPFTVKALKDKAETGFRCCVTAVILDNSGNDVEMIAAAIDGNHYSYGYTSGSRDYLRSRCVRIPESLARKLSPEIFAHI